MGYPNSCMVYHCFFFIKMDSLISGNAHMSYFCGGYSWLFTKKHRGQEMSRVVVLMLQSFFLDETRELDCFFDQLGPQTRPSDLARLSHRHNGRKVYIYISTSNPMIYQHVSYKVGRMRHILQFSCTLVIYPVNPILIHTIYIYICSCYIPTCGA